jgi:hypothetical protein
MATQPTHPTTIADATTVTVQPGAGVRERWQTRRSARAQARLTSARQRRVLAKTLRRTANHTERLRPRTRTHEPLLHYRAAAVRTDLLEIAALLEHTNNPDPARVAALQDLLANGCDSPLYNPDTHISELHATLHYVRSGL